MARTLLTPVAMPSASATTVAPSTFTWTAADVANGNALVLTGDQVLLVWNSGAGAHTVTVTSAPLNGRLATAPAHSLAAGAYKVFPRFPTAGWQQTDGRLYIDAADAEVKFAVLTID